MLLSGMTISLNQDLHPGQNKRYGKVSDVVFAVESTQRSWQAEAKWVSLELSIFY
jgi:hypothetical protein